MVFNLSFPRNTILTCFLFFFLILDLYFLIPAVTAQVFIHTAQIIIPTETLAYEANAEMEAQPLTLKIK